jgi:hypothetical protein
VKGPIANNDKASPVFAIRDHFLAKPRLRSAVESPDSPNPSQIPANFHDSSLSTAQGHIFASLAPHRLRCIACAASPALHHLRWITRAA